MDSQQPPEPIEVNYANTVIYCLNNRFNYLEIRPHLTFHTSTSGVSATISILGSCCLLRFIHNRIHTLSLRWRERAPASTQIACLMQQAIIRMNACGQNVNNVPCNCPPTWMCFSKRILDFNGRLESAQASLKLQLTPDYHSWTPAKLTLDTFAAVCRYNLQTAEHKYPILILK